MIPRPRRRVHVVLAGVLAAGILITSCSGPSYEYVRNTSLRTAFKVPSDWTLFDKQAFFGLPPGPQASTADPYRWLVAIDADPVPSVSHVLRTDALDTDYPQGIALVQEYSFSERDQASLRSLRDYVFPVTALSQNSNNAQIVTYDETIQDDGVRGVHVVFQFRLSALGAVATQADPDASELQRALLGGSGAALLSPGYVTVNQAALVDATTSRVYFIAVLCSAVCYERNRSDIQSIVDSWTVLP